MLAEPISNQVHYDPRSSKRDKNLFLAVFVVGGAAIVMPKALSAPTWVPVGAAVASLLVYAVLVTKVEKFRLREDRAGDNAYYLGFLFTLTSLSYALWAFQRRGDSDVNDVIGNFALALISTIIGLALRVWFQQLRDDPVEFEHEARLSLAEAVATVRQQLIAVSDDMALLRQRVQAELSQDFSGKAKSVHEAAIAGIKLVAKEHSEWLASTADQLKQDREAVRQLSSAQRASLAALAKALETQMLRIEKAEIPTESLRRRIDEIVDAMDRVVSTEVERSQKQVKAASDALEVMNRLLSSVRTLEPIVQKAIEAGSTTAQTVTDTSEAVKKLSAAVIEATAAIREGARVDLEQITHLSDRAKAIQTELERAASSMAANATEISGDVVKVKRALVHSVETIRRELDGGRG